MNIAGELQRVEMDERGWIVSKLGAEVFSLGLEFGDDGRVGAETGIQFSQGVVIDEVELYVFIAPALARRRVGCAQKIQLGALFHDRRGLLLRFGGFWRFLRRRLLREEEENPEDELKHVYLLWQCVQRLVVRYNVVDRQKVSKEIPFPADKYL